MKCWSIGGGLVPEVMGHHRKDSLPLPLPPPKPGAQSHNGNQWRVKPPRLRSLNMLTIVALLVFIIYNLISLQSHYIDDASDQQFVKEPDHFTEPWNDGADVNNDKVIDLRLIPESDDPPVQLLDCPRLPADQSLNVQVHTLTALPLPLVLLAARWKHQSPCHSLLCYSLTISHQINMEALWKVVSRRAIDNTIIITFASGSQSVLLRNWLCSLKVCVKHGFEYAAFRAATISTTNYSRLCEGQGPRYEFHLAGVQCRHRVLSS